MSTGLADRPSESKPPSHFRETYIGVLEGLGFDEVDRVDESGKKLRESGLLLATLVELKTHDFALSTGDEREELRGTTFFWGLRSFAYSGLAVPADRIYDAAQLAGISDDSLRHSLVFSDLEHGLAVKSVLPAEERQRLKGYGLQVMNSMGLGINGCSTPLWNRATDLGRRFFGGL